ncbi:hypothetical protein C8A05DRAFT_46500 [Staphylotrichum tortipilum]|uniref:F-box domain-containing protein n=1 Tax=Staphylotrichum tortipilum TaxID=2831512 RepID=A0AAN6RQP2_9PEZI|nr:hypothetical protein C8A05DRAFT_46500 [Staphylotrichum longicolle]
MPIRDIPPEVLSLILGQLLEDEDEEFPIVLAHLRNARLVCHQWDRLATAHLFRTVALNLAAEGGMPWRPMINSPTIQRVVRDLVICSLPDEKEFEIYETSDVDDWVTEDDDDDTSGSSPFGVAVNACVTKLPNLKSLQIRFSEQCLGARATEWWEDDEDTESISHRLQTLKTVFRAMLKRHAAVGEDNLTSTIRSLTLKNLQNVAFPPEFTSSDLYKDVIKHVTELHLMIAHEYNEPGPDHDLDRIERQTYEPYLQKELLPPLARQLRSLTLTFTECWGVMPAHFDGKGLVFPNLRTLTLGEFVIGHHDQFDWVLAQKSLETLRLDRCFIASHLRVRDDQWDQWRQHIPTHDWHQYPEGSFGFEGDQIFGFSGTWEAVYDRIHQELPKLREFCAVHHPYYNNFDRRKSMGASLSMLRYIVFESGLCPSPWIQANEHDGEMTFGNNDPAVRPRDLMGVRRYGIKQSLNRARETRLGDARAFGDLLRAVRERR